MSFLDVLRKKEQDARQAYERAKANGNKTLETVHSCRMQTYQEIITLYEESDQETL